MSFDLLQDSLRYRAVRALSPQQFNDVVLRTILDHPRNSDYDDVFDMLIDDIMASNKEVKKPKARGKAKKKGKTK